MTNVRSLWRSSIFSSVQSGSASRIHTAWEHQAVIYRITCRADSRAVQLLPRALTCSAPPWDTHVLAVAGRLTADPQRQGIALFHSLLFFFLEVLHLSVPAFLLLNLQAANYYDFNNYSLSRFLLCLSCAALVHVRSHTLTTIFSVKLCQDHTAVLYQTGLQIANSLGIIHRRTVPMRYVILQRVFELK